MGQYFPLGSDLQVIIYTFITVDGWNSIDDLFYTITLNWKNEQDGVAHPTGIKQAKENCKSVGWRVPGAWF